MKKKAVHTARLETKVTSELAEQIKECMIHGAVLILNKKHDYPLQKVVLNSQETLSPTKTISFFVEVQDGQAQHMVSRYFTNSCHSLEMETKKNHKISIWQ